MTGLGSRGLTIVQAETAAGRRALARLADRGGAVLDRATQRAAGRIVEAIRRHGDRALLESVARFDGVELVDAEKLRLSPGECDRGWTNLPAGFRAAIESAIASVERYHALQAHAGFRLEHEGVTLEERRAPLRRVGLYVPGGRAVYPSSVVMTVVPARAAGVSEIAVATPPRAYEESAALRYTLERLGVREIWGMGGAHAVAAFAYGTESIARVDKILGPGNAWVTAAKRAVVGAVAIDGIAGPSEVVIVADRGQDAGLVAADLLAQAEHDPRAAAILVTDGRELAQRVSEELERQLETLPTAATARQALEVFGLAVLVEDLRSAVPVVDAIAPEHLQLLGPVAESLVDSFQNAGAIFLGPFTPEVFGDYVAGPSHVLPTCGTARFASALGVEDFVRRSHVIRCTPAAAVRLAGPAALLADVEGLPAHASAARRRA
ncbi:MAG: histidinol dehydrogenase [Acidobacteriota bacterium]